MQPLASKITLNKVKVSTCSFWLTGHPKAMSLYNHAQPKDVCRQKKLS